jgi:hypothetical protein
VSCRRSTPLTTRAVIMVISPAADTPHVLDRSDAALRGARPPSPWQHNRDARSIRAHFRSLLGRVTAPWSGFGPARNPCSGEIAAVLRFGIGLTLVDSKKPRRDICGRGKGRTMENPVFLYRSLPCRCDLPHIPCRHRSHHLAPSQDSTDEVIPVSALAALPARRGDGGACLGIGAGRCAGHGDRPKADR